MEVRNHRDLIVWQRGIALVKAIYQLTERFPHSEIYGLVSQMRRAAVSIPSNIAEGRGRKSSKEYRHFIFNAIGSGAELDTQITICKDLPTTRNLDYDDVEKILEEILKMLHSTANTLDGLMKND